MSSGLSASRSSAAARTGKVPGATARTGLGASPDPVFDRFAAMVRTVLRVPVALVSLPGPGGRVFPGAAGLAEPWRTERRAAGYVADADEPLAIPDARVRRDERVPGGLGIVGYAGVPLTDADGTVLGTLCVIDAVPRTWTGEELALLADLGAACSDGLRLRIATRRAEAGQGAALDRGDRLRGAFDRSQVLLNASVALTGTTTIDDVVAAVGRLVSNVLEPADIGIALFTGEPELATFAPLPADLAGRWAGFAASALHPAVNAARAGRLYVLANPEAIRAAFPQPATDLGRLGWQAVACAPLLHGDGALGVLTFAWRQPRDVDLDEQAVILTIAGYVTQALDRADHLLHEHTAAATLQQALLTPLPAIEGLHLAARYIPAHEDDHVGGDWYDAIALPGGRLALVIGDVCGHSLEAAATMSELRSMLRAFVADRDEPPSATLRRLDTACRALRQEIFATVVLARLEPAPSGGFTLLWSNAGHPPPTLLVPGAAPRLLTEHDLLLGVDPATPRHDHVVDIAEGATLLLYTDGLIESRTSTVDAGLAQLHETLRERPGDGARRVADHVVTHTDTHRHDDDIALLTVHVRQRPAPRAAPEGS
ncbi:SpoIIE family protein phosphatase [Dactylosporangium sp. CS-047395]|uniref:SpoIIE family protein phosphatase n=1 Tax=Dactylosporangium sp. CS-047395 TaxID=3239936 RepID=UPI003D8A273B